MLHRFAGRCPTRGQISLGADLREIVCRGAVTGKLGQLLIDEGDQLGLAQGTNFGSGELTVLE